MVFPTAVPERSAASETPERGALPVFGFAERVTLRVGAGGMTTVLFTVTVTDAIAERLPATSVERAVMV